MKSIQRFFDATDLKDQQVYENEHWRVVLPGTPVSPHHLLVIVKSADTFVFTDLNDEELASLRACVAHLSRCYKNKYSDTFDGYNLFSNNGSIRIGKHIQNFHEHIFLRLTDEPELPYDVMYRRESWSQSGEPEWVEQKESLSRLFTNN